MARSNQNVAVKSLPNSSGSKRVKKASKFHSHDTTVIAISSDSGGSELLRVQEKPIQPDYSCDGRDPDPQVSHRNSSSGSVSLKTSAVFSVGHVVSRAPQEDEGENTNLISTARFEGLALKRELEDTASSPPLVVLPLAVAGPSPEKTRRYKSRVPYVFFEDNFKYLTKRINSAAKNGGDKRGGLFSHEK